MNPRLLLLACILASGLFLGWLAANVSDTPAQRPVADAWGTPPTKATTVVPSGASNPAPRLPSAAAGAAAEARPNADLPPGGETTFEFAPPEPEPDLTGDLPTLEQRWRDLRALGKWRQAEPLWLRIKQLRQLAAGGDSTADVPEPEPAYEPGPDGTPALVQNGTLKGRVVDPSGRGLAGASITLLGALSAPGAATGRGFHRTVESDAQGCFRLELLPPTEVNVFADMPGRVLAKALLVRIKPGPLITVMDDVVMEPAAQLRARLVLDGKPASEGVVAVIFFDSSGRLIQKAPATVRAGGEFVLTCPRADAATFTVSRAGFETSPSIACRLTPGVVYDAGEIDLRLKG